MSGRSEVAVRHTADKLSASRQQLQNKRFNFKTIPTHLIPDLVFLRYLFTLFCGRFPSVSTIIGMNYWFINVKCEKPHLMLIDKKRG